MYGIKWSDVSKFRNELFGLSIISIIIFHFFEGVAGAEYVGRTLKLFAKAYNGVVGSVGVDIFLLLSGFGIYYSLSKNTTPLSFYSKRLKRVMIPYCVLGGIFWIVKDLVIQHETLWTFLLDYSLLSFWCRGVRTFWYISFICLMYLISPIIYSSGKKSVFAGVILSMALCVILYFTDETLFSSIEIAVTRIPIYLLGMYCGELSQENRSIGGGTILAFSLSIPVKLISGLTDFPFARFFNGFYAIMIVLLYVAWRSRRNGYQEFNLLSKIGGLSLELYVVHVAIRNIMGLFNMKLANPLVYLMCIAVSVFLSIVFTDLKRQKTGMGIR